MIARTSSFKFKAENQDIREIGRLLGVTHVLEDSVQFSTEGFEYCYIELPAPNLTQCGFDGETMRAIYITSARVGLDKKGLNNYPQSGDIFSGKLPLRGIPIQAISMPDTGD